MGERNAAYGQGEVFESRAVAEAFQNYYYEWYLKRVSPFMLLFGGVLCILSALYMAIGMDFQAGGAPAMFLALIDGLAGLLLLLAYLYLRSLIGEFKRIGRRTSADYFASGLIVIYSIIIGTAPQMPARSAIFVFGVMSLLLVPRLKPLRLLITAGISAAAFVAVDAAMQADASKIAYSAIEAFAAVALAYTLSAMSFSNRVEAFTYNYKLNIANSALKAESELDSLTGLVSKKRSSSMFTHEWARAKRNKSSISLLMVDIDGVKPAEDEMVLAVAESLRAAVKRGSDILVRCTAEPSSAIGRCEFMVLLPDTPIEGAKVVVGNISEAVRAKSVKGLSIAIGAASSVPAEELDMQAMLERAEEALKAARPAAEMAN